MVAPVEKLNIQIPSTLKKQLVDDHEHITHLSKVSRSFFELPFCVFFGKPINGWNLVSKYLILLCSFDNEKDIN